jgi:hypothetical protein
MPTYKNKQFGEMKMEMLKFIIDENQQQDGGHHIHNASLGCTNLPEVDAQILIGYFANYDFAYKRARMNWPREKVTACPNCCQV